ncbi:hypothetical protein GCM10007874_55150 [Labrys miyagiensis]|uniref:DUF2867 domain-containing protein n=1 Tax=Labrys miyagiensis TaxID=346912 RepID=A0ABQ6CW25_9HYPH|nr:hypothetical protein [Labrys miyagiensis]GLS22497.1 hypothetical protein GCM10007874_55150 [Labrys miyagiensis]
MSYDDIQSATVVQYPYLWHREAERGELEGRKDRPVAVGVRIPQPDGVDLLLLFPITSKQPAASQFAAEIPETEKRRAGLSTDIRLWIILEEFNGDRVGRSYYLKPAAVLGRFSKAFFLPLMKQVIARRSRLAAVDRGS